MVCWDLISRQTHSLEQMKTRLLFFGRLGEQLGRSLNVDMPDGGCSIRELRHLIAEQHRDAAPLILDPRIRASIDQHLAADEDRAGGGQEIAFFSPLSGG